jgi:hypothetical protein
LGFLKQIGATTDTKSSPKTKLSNQNRHSDSFPVVCLEDSRRGTDLAIIVLLGRIK